MKSKRRRASRLGTLLLACAALSAGCSDKFILGQAGKGFERFIRRPSETRLIKVTSRVMAFQWHHYTTLVISGDTGFIVVDPANQRSARLLKEALAAEFPKRLVHTLVYSHFHLDHTGGGRIFEGTKDVIGHQDVPRHLADFPAHDTLLPTRLLKGEDQSLLLDGVRLDFLHLPESHTNTMFAIYLPEESALYAADLATVNTMPFILMDMYLPGVIRALEKIDRYPYRHFVSSHFDPGTKQDFGRSLEFFRDVRNITQGAFAKHGPFHDDPVKTSSAIQNQIYDDLEAKYGNLWGFHDLFVPFIGRAFLAGQCQVLAKTWSCGEGQCWASLEVDLPEDEFLELGVPASARQ